MTHTHSNLTSPHSDCTSGMSFTHCSSATRFSFSSTLPCRHTASRQNALCVEEEAAEGRARPGAAGDAGALSAAFDNRARAPIAMRGRSSRGRHTAFNTGEALSSTRATVAHAASNSAPALTLSPCGYRQTQKSDQRIQNKILLFNNIHFSSCTRCNTRHAPGQRRGCQVLPRRMRPRWRQR